MTSNPGPQRDFLLFWAILSFVSLFLLEPTKIPIMPHSLQSESPTAPSPNISKILHKLVKITSEPHHQTNHRKLHFIVINSIIILCCHLSVGKTKIPKVHQLKGWRFYWGSEFSFEIFTLNLWLKGIGGGGHSVGRRSSFLGSQKAVR